MVKNKEERFLYVKVIDQETEEGIKAARVRYTSETGNSAVKTGESGEVMMSFPKKTKLSLAIKAKGYAGARKKNVKLTKNKFLVFKISRK